MTRKNQKEWVPCPYCGEDIESDASSCKFCGSDEATGWSESTYMDGIDLPDDDDYTESVQKELGELLGTPPTPRFYGIPTWVVIGGTILLILFVVGLLRNLPL